MLGKTLIIEYGLNCIKALAAETSAQKPKVLYKRVFRFEGDDFEKSVTELASECNPSEFKQIILSVSRKKFLSHFYSFPSSEKSEVNNMLELQLMTHEKELKDECIKAYSCTPDINGSSWVHLFLLQRNIIEPFAESLTRQDFNISRVSVSSYGLKNWAPKELAGFSKEKDFVVLVDVDKESAECLVLKEGNLLFSRLFNYNGNAIAFANGLKQSLGNFEMNFGKCNLDYLYLSGVLDYVDVKLLDVKELLAEESSGDIEDSFNSLVGFCYPFGEDFLDFTPEHILEVKRTKVKKYHVLEIAKTVFQILVLIGLILFMNVFVMQQKALKLRHEVDKVGANAFVLKQMAKELKYYGIKRKNYPFFSEIFDDVFSVVPKGLYLNSVDIKNDNSLYVKGYSNEISYVFDFVKALNARETISDIKADYVRKQSSSKKSSHEFYLVGKVK